MMARIRKANEFPYLKPNQPITAPSKWNKQENPKIAKASLCL